MDYKNDVTFDVTIFRSPFGRAKKSPTRFLMTYAKCGCRKSGTASAPERQLTVLKGEKRCAKMEYTI